MQIVTINSKLASGFCKFGDKCAYLHENKFTVLDSKIVKLEMEIKKVTEAIENLNKKQDFVSLHSSISNAISIDPSKSPTTQAANSFSSLEASSGYFDTTAQSEVSMKYLVIHTALYINLLLTLLIYSKIFLHLETTAFLNHQKMNLKNLTAAMHVECTSPLPRNIQSL